MRIATQMELPQLQARCLIWYGISLMQKGRLAASATLLRRVFRAHSARGGQSDPKIRSMCLGVWARLQYLWTCQAGQPLFMAETIDVDKL